MIKNAWRILAAVSVIALVGSSGCVVGSSDDEDGGSGGSLGGSGGSKGGTGGATGGGTGGAVTGGGGVTGGGTGGAVTGGGTGGTGGSAGYTCDATGGTPGSCTATGTDPCELCIQNKCCTEWGACTAAQNPCGSGAPDGGGEIFCMQACFVKETGNGSSADDAKAKCGNDCVSPTCGTISGETNDAFSCLESSCLTECLTT